MDAAATIEDIPRELWSTIVEYLGPWDALQLRQTSKAFHTVVVECQQYWYRQFTWFLIKQNLRVALWKTACKRSHNPEIAPSLNCISLSDEETLAVQLGIAVADLPREIEVNPRLLMTFKCTNPQHYIFEVPKTRFHIPIDPSDYHPAQQVYVYRFLIHNYRHRRERSRRFTKHAVNDELKASKKRLATLQIETERLRRRIALLQETATELKMLETNTVFFGYKSRSYR
jgi:hypothetical protein